MKIEKTLAESLDDAGLTVHQFRIAWHLILWVETGKCPPSAESMAWACRMKRDTVFKALKALQERNIIRKIPRKGLPCDYVIAMPKHWRKTP